MAGRINVADFNLAITLESGQAFRWSRNADGWYSGIVDGEVWRLRQIETVLEWETSSPHPNPLPASRAKGSNPFSSPVPCTGEGHGEGKIRRYFSLDRELTEIVATFPDDLLLRTAVQRHWGLRILRQEPWETLASFIASSTKQITQIRQIVELLASRFGKPLTGRCRPALRVGDVVSNHAGSQKLAATTPATGWMFPTVEVIARATLPELQACKLGFRAKYLLAAARRIDRGEIRLAELSKMDYRRALEELLKLDGVGQKIADCVLLFSCGHDAAFPVDVWVQRALRRSGRRPAEYGPFAGWAQQYLFVQERARRRQPLLDGGSQ